MVCQLAYSEKTAELIDSEVKSLIETQYDRAIDLLENNKDKLIKLADKLLEEEVIFKEDLEDIFGKRPWNKEEEVKVESNGHEAPAETPKPEAQDEQPEVEKEA